MSYQSYLQPINSWRCSGRKRIPSSQRSSHRWTPTPFRICATVNAGTFHKTLTYTLITVPDATTLTSITPLRDDPTSPLRFCPRHWLRAGNLSLPLPQSPAPQAGFQAASPPFAAHDEAQPPPSPPPSGSPLPRRAAPARSISDGDPGASAPHQSLVASLDGATFACARRQTDA